MKKILVITTEPLPFPHGMTTGAGLRAWGLAQALKSKGFTVILGTPLEGEQAHKQSIDLDLQDQVSFFLREDLPHTIEQVAPDIIVLQHWGLAYALPDPLPCPLVIDLAGPHLLERKFWGNPNKHQDLQEKIAALKRADFITCGGQRQQHYFHPFLRDAGFNITPNDIPVIPFSAPPDPPQNLRHTPEPLTFVFGGAFLAWQNAERPITWLLETMDEMNSGRFLFYGGSHPGLDASGGKFLQLITKLRKHPRVEMRGWKSFDQLCYEYNSECHVALDLMEHNEERELAYTTRTIIYMYCGLPVIYNNYSELSDLIQQSNSGWTLSPGDEGKFKSLIRSLISNPSIAAEIGSNAQTTALKQNWNATIAPLAQYCEKPILRRNKQNQPTGHASDDTLHGSYSPTVSNAPPFQRNFFTNPGKYVGILIYIPVWVVCKLLCSLLKLTNSPRAHKN